jgi:hypothetical protein
VTLWTAATHAQPAWEHAPRLAVVSPLKRCGKSRLLDVVAETCHAPLITINATIAAVVRSIGADPPTLLVDEADTLWGTRKQADNNEDLRGLLNAGHQRNRPMLRWDITSRTAEQLDTFAMALLAAIGELPDTIMDRAVVVRMRRRAPGEHVDPYRTRRDAPPLNKLRDRLAAWARAQLRDLQHATPQMPLEDRAADTWEPLIAIADLAQGDWPARARHAAQAMTAAEVQHEEDTAASVRLLADLRQVFGAAEARSTPPPSWRRCTSSRTPPGPTGTATRCPPATWPSCCAPTTSAPRASASTAPAPPSRATPAPTCMTPGSATRPQRHIRHKPANPQLRRPLRMCRRTNRLPTHPTQTTTATWRMCRRSPRRPPQG